MLKRCRYTCKLYPTKTQEEILLRYSGACRFFDWLWWKKTDMLEGVILLWLFFSGMIMLFGGFIAIPVMLYTAGGMMNEDGTITTFELWFCWAVLLTWVFIALLKIVTFMIPIVHEEIDIYKRDL